MLDMASNISLLPPEATSLPPLHPPLAEVFGTFCAANPDMANRYPGVGGAALRSLLRRKTLNLLCQVSTLLGLDISMCDNKADVIQSLLDARKPLTREWFRFGVVNSTREMNLFARCAPSTNFRLSRSTERHSK